MKLILASASVARRDLLKAARIPFEIVVSNVHEIRGRGRTLAQTVLENALRKASAVARRHPGRWVLAADSSVGFEGRIYGKPPSRKAAVELLSRFAGRVHILATGVVLTNGRRTKRAVIKTKVRVRDLDAASIARILAKQDPTSVAGGYCVRRKNDPLIERIDGSFSNVLGLPMEWTLPLLKRLT